MKIRPRNKEGKPPPYPKIKVEHNANSKNELPNIKKSIHGDICMCMELGWVEFKTSQQSNVQNCEASQRRRKKRSLVLGASNKGHCTKHMVKI
jgi:hypothetical protein